MVSGRVKLIKPDAAIFHYLMDTFDLEAGDIFFVDDHAPNVISARSLGIYAHHFQDAAKLRADLRASGLLDDES